MKKISYLQTKNPFSAYYKMKNKDRNRINKSATLMENNLKAKDKLNKIKSADIERTKRAKVKGDYGKLFPYMKKKQMNPKIIKAGVTTYAFKAGSDAIDDYSENKYRYRDQAIARNNANAQATDINQVANSTANNTQGLSAGTQSPEQVFGDIFAALN